MRGVNMVVLVGQLGADPEVRYTNSSAAITTIRVATSEQWRDKQTGERQERTEWHRVKLFGKLAEIAGEYLRKGSQVYIQGSNRTEKYTDKDGIERYSTYVIANEMQMLGGRQGGEFSGNSGNAHRNNDQFETPTGAGSNRQGNGNPPPPRQGNSNPPPPRQGGAGPYEAGHGSDNFKDDIPFITNKSIW